MNTFHGVLLRLSVPPTFNGSSGFMTPVATTVATAPAVVSTAIPALTFNGMSAIIFLRRLWKILRLTSSIRQPNHQVNNFWDTNATIAIVTRSS
jgi:hypothetical protein